MQRLKQSGSLYCIYKGFYSLVLKAISDANYCFMHVDIGNVEVEMTVEFQIIFR